MSYNNPGFPTQKTAYSHVNDGIKSDDIQYIQKQSDLIKSQNQPYIGHMPKYINPTPNDNIIQQVRFTTDAQSTRYNPNKLSNENNLNSTCGNNENIDSSKIFTGPNKDYNPHLDYLTKKGLLNDNYKTRTKTTHINIDSKSRRVNVEIKKENEILLDENSMYYSSTTLSSITSTAIINLLNIIVPSNHNFIVGDRITINNVSSELFSIKALYDYNSNGITRNGHSLIFENNRRSLVIRTNFEKSVYYSNGYILENSQLVNDSLEPFNPNFNIGDGISYENLKNYDTTDMFVEFSGFDGTNIGNIPTNFLNSTHRVHLTNPDSSGDIYINIPDGNGIVKKITGFYIELTTKFKSSNNQSVSPLDPAIYSNMVINMNFKYIGGIPINFINADIPISNTNINGYHEIVNVSRNLINIRLNKKTYYINQTPPENPEIGQVPIKFGNDTIYISKVSEIIGGYPEPNNYIIELPESINNIFMVELAGTIFPNTSRTFKNLKNNKIYWQNIDDGDIVYSATIDEGNYDPNTLKNELEKKMYNVVRQDIPESPENIFTSATVTDPDLLNSNGEVIPPTNKGGYTNRVLFIINIDDKTNIASFSSFKEAKLRRPIIKIRDSSTPPKPPPDQNSINEPYEPPYTLKICHPSHGLQIGDEVTFSGFITSSGIPDTILNTQHKIINITSDDTYEIKIDNFNLSSNRSNEQGGYSAKVYVKNTFRLLFDKDDTMGVQLGFRNIGNEISITKYGTTITNQEAYQNETVIYEPPTGLRYISDGSGKLIVLKNNSLQFSGEDYILMVIREFAGSINISQNKQLTNYFAKINLSGLPGKILFDSFVSAPITFYNIFNLGKISVSFIGSNGDYYDFNGVDHSFKLVFTSLDLLPQETGINSNNNVL
jgi:hypothetical protein